MLAFAITPGDGRLLIGAVIVAAAWLLLAMMTANYGANRGFSFGALFMCALFLGFPLVLLAITIGSPILARKDGLSTTSDDGDS